MPSSKRTKSFAWPGDPPPGGVPTLECRIIDADGGVLAEWGVVPVPVYVIYDTSSGMYWYELAPAIDNLLAGFIRVRHTVSVDNFMSLPFDVVADANLASMATRFLAMTAASGGDWQYDALALALGPAGGGGGGVGTGANSITLTVVDNLNSPLNGAIVRFTGGPTPSVGPTNVNGDHVTGLDAGTYTLTVTFPGKQSIVRSEVITVSATLANVVLLALPGVAAPPDAANCRLFGTMKKKDTVTANPAATLRWRLLDGPGTAGFVFERGDNEAVSDVAGLVQFDVPINSKVQVAIGTGLWHDVTAGAGPTQAIDEVLGKLGEG